MIFEKKEYGFRSFNKINIIRIMVIFFKKYLEVVKRNFKFFKI